MAETCRLIVCRAESRRRGDSWLADRKPTERSVTLIGSDAWLTGTGTTVADSNTRVADEN